MRRTDTIKNNYTNYIPSEIRPPIMEDTEINRLIENKVDQIEDSNQRQFIKDILAFERSKMDREQPHYKNDYHDKIDELATGDE